MWKEEKDKRRQEVNIYFITINSVIYILHVIIASIVYNRWSMRNVNVYEVIIERV